MNLWDIIFPKYCVNCRKSGAYICDNCFSFISFDIQMICLLCNKPSYDGLTHPGCRRKHAIDGAISAIAYKGIVKKLIYSFKYKPYVTDLKESLVNLFYESIIQNELFQELYKQKPLLVPIPLHNERLRKRGYNHSSILAKELAKKLDLEYREVLKRTKKTKSQFGLNLNKRKENLSGAFSLIGNSVKKYPVIFLVDDILTSGTTLYEASNVLKKAGVEKVFGMTLARD